VEPGTAFAMRWWAGLLGGRARAKGLTVNDRVIGLAWSGAFDVTRMRQAVSALGEGITEIYCHPATADTWPGQAPGYRYRDELAALTDPAVARALADDGVRRGSFAQFAARDRLAA
jgi:predicted glycoside hydrolase/deacetylase ChbG (UPF0249 family)